MTISDQFEELIEQQKIKFNKVSKAKLDQWTRDTVIVFLEPANIGWELGDVKIGNACCLKIDDDYIQYIDSLPDTEQFLWSTDNHHTGIHPDVASAYLATKTIPGSTARCWTDDKTGDRFIEMTANGRTVQMIDRTVNGERTIKCKMMPPKGI